MQGAAGVPPNNPRATSVSPSRPPIDVPYYWPPDALSAAPLPDLDAMIRNAGIDTTAPFLFIGILSSQRTFRRRITVTSTWLQYVTHTPTHLVEARFVLTPDEVCPWACAVEESLCVVRGQRVAGSRGGHFAIQRNRGAEVYH